MYIIQRGRRRRASALEFSANESQQSPQTWAFCPPLFPSLSSLSCCLVEPQRDPPVPLFPLRSSAQTTVSLRQLEVNTQPLTCSGYLAPLVTRFSNFHVCSYACGLHFPLYRPLEVDEIGFTCVSADRRFPKIQEIGANLSVHLLFYMPASGLYRNTFCCNYLVITMKKSHISTTRD